MAEYPKLCTIRLDDDGGDDLEHGGCAALVTTLLRLQLQLHKPWSNQIKVADDPETLRIKQNTKNISNVAYHGDLQKKAAMERQRECTEIIDSKGE